MTEGKLPFLWPPAVREAVIVRDPRLLTLREQSLDYLEDRAKYLENYYQAIIDTFLGEPLNGRCLVGQNEDGTENPNETIFVLGSTSISIECDDSMIPRLCAHAFDLQADPVVATSEASYIAQVIEAFIYSKCPDKAVWLLNMGKKFLRNGHTVNGIDDLSTRLKSDPMLLNNAVSGANIEKEEVTDVPTG